MAFTANIHEAKTTLSKLIQRALNGEEVVIAKAGKPLVRLAPVRHDGEHPGEDRLAIFDKFQGQVIRDEDWEQSEFDADTLERFYGDAPANPSDLPRAAEPKTVFRDR